MYAVVALSIAFASYNLGLPMTLRSAFYPLMGEAVWGRFGHGIDILAVFATLFGLATSLGLGAQQLAAGLAHLWLPTSKPISTKSTRTGRLVAYWKLFFCQNEALETAIWRWSEYFLNTFASLCRRSWVTHLSATPPALKRVAYVQRRSAI